MFAGFLKDLRHVNGVDIAYRLGGSGPGLLLLHGHPQTHVIWHKIAEHLALPVLVLWGAEGKVGRCFDPLVEWQKVALDVRGQALPCGHYLVAGW